MLLYLSILGVSPAAAATGLSASPLFTLDTRTFLGHDSLLFTLDTRTFLGHDSPLFTLDTRITTDTPAIAGGNRLLGGSPNPFNPTTRIEFEMVAPGPVTLAVYDIRGRLVHSILDRVHYDRGLYRELWRGREANGQAAAAGVYFVRCRMGVDIGIQAITLVK